MRFPEDVKMFEEEIISIRRKIHENPELGNKEEKTAVLVETVLQKLGILTKRPYGTAVVGYLSMGEGLPTVALRADMDALPIQENTNCLYQSKVAGIMHACGHDVHTAALLGAAMILSRQTERLKGNILFIFEPDEEGNGGAHKICQEGVLDDVDAVFGGHVSPEIPLGKVGIRRGKFYAASDMFKIEVFGQTSHGATPEKGKNALLAAAEMICEISRLSNQCTESPSVLTIGIVNGGVARNVVADYASFEGIIRTLGAQDRETMQKVLNEKVNTIADKYSVKANVEIYKSYDGIVNTDKETNLAQEAAAEVLGSENVIHIEEPTMTTEDFGTYIDGRGGSFYHIGAGCSDALHSAMFLPDEKSVLIMALVHANTAIRYLEQKCQD